VLCGDNFAPVHHVHHAVQSDGGEWITASLPSNADTASATLRGWPAEMGYGKMQVAGRGRGRRGLALPLPPTVTHIHAVPAGASPALCRGPSSSSPAQRTVNFPFHSAFSLWQCVFVLSVLYCA